MKITISLNEDFVSESGVVMKIWKNMTPAQKKSYIKKHPNSKYSPKSKKS